MVGDARVGATPELVDLYVVEGRLESAIGAIDAAERALDHAAHVAERLPPGPWRVQIEVSIGYQRFPLGRPLEAHEAFVRAAEIAPPASASAIAAMSGDAVALAALGRFDEARTVALEGIELAGRVAVRWRLAHLWDCLGVVEHMADRPHAALRAFDEAFAILGAETQETLRFSILAHRTETLAMLERTRAAEQARALAERVLSRMGSVGPVYEGVWAVAQARLFEARGEFSAVLPVVLPMIEKSRHYRVGDALLACARAALAQNKVDDARDFAERACLLGFESGCIFPGRKHNLGRVGIGAHLSRQPRGAFRRFDAEAVGGRARPSAQRGAFVGGELRPAKVAELVRGPSGLDYDAHRRRARPHGRSAHRGRVVRTFRGHGRARRARREKGRRLDAPPRARAAPRADAPPRASTGLLPRTS